MPKDLNNNSSCLLQILASIIGGVLFWYIIKNIFLWVPSLGEVLGFIKEPLRTSATLRVMALIVAIFIAILLYQLKKRLIILFGFIEFAGGGWTIWEMFSQEFENNLLYALALAGGIFLMINGFDNIMNYSNPKKNKTVDQDF